MSFVTGQYAERQVLKSTAQNLTDAWVDLGGEIDTRGFNRVALWLTLDINDSNNPRVKALAKHTAAGTEEYNLPIKTVGAASVAVEAEYFEFNVDADGLFVLTWDIDNVVPYVQFQVQAGTVGTTAGQIDAAYVTLGY